MRRDRQGAYRAEGDLPFARRLWRYLGERFAPVTNGVLIAAFASAGVCVSRLARDTAGWPAPAAFAVAFAVLYLLFFQLRVADEHKDFADDSRYRPERAVPRGLVRLGELRRLAVAAAVLELALAVSLAPALLPVLLLTWGWMALMAVEFFAPAWLKARPVTYLLSHMLVMPLFALFAVACERLPAGQAGDGLTAIGAFLALAFANGVVLEIARKSWAPEAEREGVESYSKLWGPRLAGSALMLVAGAALALAIMVNRFTGGSGIVLLLVIAVSLSMLGASARYAAAPDPGAAKRLQTSAGLSVLLHYLALGPIALALAWWPA